ncbi:CopM family metallochaperone [Elioraea rosea]|uniref:CopM family metallochaperone n=1 Tax=Elioraea rosea TaxID=2492390 RepID=UPI001EF65496|nr:DUF305 domain-containing protein [Elioraea rosea]
MRRSIVMTGLLAAVVGGWVGYALAQGMPPAHRMPGGQMMPGMQHGSPDGVASPSTTAYRAAMDKMHRDMAITYTGDADKDFAAGMIPHHQGAIDMARIVLDHGKDDEVRKLAQDIIAAQEKEITQMRAILARLGRS